MTALPQAAERVRAAGAALGLEIAVRQHDAPTRTAPEAAAACGCDVGQIVKSLVFRGRTSGRPLLLLVSGRNRVDEKGVAAHIGEKLERPDADYVRDVTGFAIGGIPPLGHASTLATYMDRDLLGHETVWAAAGTPNTVFPVSPAALARVTGATIIDVA